MVLKKLTNMKYEVKDMSRSLILIMRKMIKGVKNEVGKI